MKKEQWEFITNNWGTADPVIMEEIAKIKDSDEAELRALQLSVDERDKTIRELTQQNVDLNKTNMNLILRLTDPALQPQTDDNDNDPEPVSLDDYDAFILREED